MNQIAENNEENLLIADQNQISQPDTQPAKVTIQPTMAQQILELVKSDEYNYYQYPPTLEKAQIHRESYYLCPDKSIVDKYAKEECECCKKKIYRKPFNWLCGDLYDLVVEEFGVAIPLYFTLIKFQIVIFVIVFGLYGIFFMYQTQQLCMNYDTCDGNDNDCIQCQFSQSYHFTDIVAIQEYLLHQEDANKYNYFQAVAFIVFLINLHLPFLYDLLLSYIEIKYWNRDPFQSQTETSHSIYVRHLKQKHDPEEIFELIKTSIEKNPNPEVAQRSKELVQPILEEVVYIHDTSEITLLLQKRQEILSKIVSQAYKLDTARTAQISSDLQFQEIFVKLKEVNLEIEKLVGNAKFNNLLDSKGTLNLEPLPFSRKALIRFREESIYLLILSHFKRSFWQNLKIKLNFIIHPKIVDKIAVKKSFRINGLFWEHIGMKSYDRVVIKIKSLVTMILACVALMVAYELIYLYANDPEFKVNKDNGNLTKAEKAATNIFTILVPIITTSAIIIVIMNQKKAKKNTFSHQERGYMHFLIVVNYLLVTFVPYIITFEFWNGKQFANAIYNLVTLTQNKLITKNIFHTLHIRWMTNLLKKRKAIKNYKNYFQGEFNNLLTPAAFPQRSRNCNAMYSLTIGLCLIYVCPLITLIAFFFNCYIYLYDRYSITHFYTLDKRFTIALMRHQIKVYSIAFYPIKIYLFMKIFWNYGWLIYAGVPVCIGVSITGILFRRKIVNFILFSIFGLEKQQNTSYQAKTYTKSYQEYIKGIKLINFRLKNR